MIGASFDSTKTPLQELLARARTGTAAPRLPAWMGVR